MVLQGKKQNHVHCRSGAIVSQSDGGLLEIHGLFTENNEPAPRCVFLAAYILYKEGGMFFVETRQVGTGAGLLAKSQKFSKKFCHIY